MPRPRSSRGFGRDRQRRKFQWSLGPGGDDIATLDVASKSASTTFILGAGISPTTQQLTLVRTHGHLELGLSAADAALTGFNWTAGIGICTSDAFAVGVTAVPDPFDDIQWPGWLWMASGGLHTSVGALAVGDPSVNPVIVPIDSKAMRILRLNEILFLSVQIGEVVSATIQVRGMTRTLFKLP